MASQLSNTVVLIEDQEVIAATISYIIESCGAAVETADGIASGVELIERVRPKVILLDVELPDGNGIDLCAAIRAEPSVANAYVVLLSTHDTETLRAMAKQAGANGFVCKPFDPDQLMDLVQRALSSSGNAELPAAP